MFKDIIRYFLLSKKYSKNNLKKKNLKKSEYCDKERQNSIKNACNYFVFVIIK